MEMFNIIEIRSKYPSHQLLSFQTMEILWKSKNNRRVQFGGEPTRIQVNGADSMSAWSKSRDRGLHQFHFLRPRSFFFFFDFMEHA